MVDVMVFTAVGTACLGFFSLLYIPRAAEYYKLIISVLALLFFSLVHTLYTGFAEFTFIDIAFKLLVYALAAEFLVVLYRRVYSDFEVLIVLRHILYATVVNSLFVYAAFFSGSFQSFIAGIMDYESQLNWLVTQHRIFDLSLGGGATASFTFFIVFLIGLFIPTNYRGRLNLPMLVIIATAAALMGRSGLYFIIVMTTVALLYNFISSKWRLFLSMIVVMFIAWIVFLIYQDVVSDSAYIKWVMQGFGDINRTASALTSMWFLPDSNLLFGDGHFGRVYPNIIFSDIGYVRFVHAGGFIGVFLLYGWLIGLSLMLLKFGKNIEFPLSYLFPLIVFFILIMNFKEAHYASRGTTVITFIVFFVVAAYSRSKVKAASACPSG